MSKITVEEEEVKVVKPLAINIKLSLEEARELLKALGTTTRCYSLFCDLKDVVVKRLS